MISGMFWKHVAKSDLDQVGNVIGCKAHGSLPPRTSQYQGPHVLKIHIENCDIIY